MAVTEQVKVLNEASQHSGSQSAMPLALPPTAQTASKPSAIVDLNSLQSASRVLHDQFLKDSQIIPDLGELLLGVSSNNYPVS